MQLKLNYFGKTEKLESGGYVIHHFSKIIDITIDMDIILRLGHIVDHGMVLDIASVGYDISLYQYHIFLKNTPIPEGFFEKSGWNHTTIEK